MGSEEILQRLWKLLEAKYPAISGPGFLRRLSQRDCIADFLKELKDSRWLEVKDGDK